MGAKEDDPVPEKHHILFGHGFTLSPGYANHFGHYQPVIGLLPTVGNPVMAAIISSNSSLPWKRLFPDLTVFVQ
jgi:hypothetical protein